MKQDPHKADAAVAAAAEVEHPPVPWSTYQAVLRERDAHYQMLQKEYQSVLDMSGRGICRYLIKSRQAIVSPSLAEDSKLPAFIEDLPHWHLAQNRIAPESVAAWLNLFSAIEQGEEKGQAEIVFLIEGGKKRRCLLDFVAFRGPDGQPASAVLFSKDITERYEHDRLQALEREALLLVARKSFPEILAVNLTKKTYRMLQYYADTQLDTPRQGAFQDMIALRLAHVSPEDQAAFSAAFGLESLRSAFQQGKASVQLAYRRAGKNGLWHWVETTVIPVPNPYDRDILALAVSRNIDEQKRLEESLSQALDTTSGLLNDRLYYDSLCHEIFPGLICISYLDERPTPYTGGKMAQQLGCSVTELALGRGARIHPEDRGAVAQAQEQAERSGAESYLTEYRMQDSQGQWVRISNRAVAFTDRQGDRGYAHFLTDITREHELTDRLRRYAEQDAMTGLLRRDYGESQIRRHLAQPNRAGGILVILDMDNLKGLNDTLGHDQGDRAIQAIAETLRGHFRRDDLVVRLGGDEFMLYLPGASNGQTAVAASMAALIQKLGKLTVGPQNEWPIHCSAGCTVEQSGQDTFESLYRRADLALYYVKRHGKNSFAFFTSDMLPHSVPPSPKEPRTAYSDSSDLESEREGTHDNTNPSAAGR